MTLDEVMALLGALPEKDRAKAIAEADAALSAVCWIPSPGPQTDAMLSRADLMLYGGQAGGGKTDLLLGLALTEHRRSLILRKQYTDLSSITERAVAIHGTRDGFSGAPPPKLRTKDGRLVEFGACMRLGDEQHWQGNAHDLLAFDEGCQFLEQQVRFLMGWVRSAEPGQRCRTVLASNPPVNADGEWIIGMFRPWLDVTHPKPAKPGELRWFVTDPDGKDLEVDGPAPLDMGGKTLIPKSRTFVPARLSDNAFLADTGYQAQLDAMPEPLRSAMRDGNFMLGRKDSEWQAIPTAWVREAQSRWTPRSPHGVPMCAIGVDVAQGGADESVLAIRHDGWFAPLVTVPGAKTPFGKDIAGLIIANRRDEATVIIDMGGGYGGAALEHLKANDSLFPVVGYKGAEASRRRSRDNKLAYVNKRSAAIWGFREALDPSQPGGSPIALPDDPMLVADLTAPTFEVGSRGIKIESKEDVCKRLGRSTDRGDAVVMCWTAGTKDVMDHIGGLEMGRMQKRPTVVMGHQAARR